MQRSERIPVLVSACLLGLETRYNGICKKNKNVIDFLSSDHWTMIPVCPEQLGGLPTPRPESEFSNGDGNDVLDGNGRVENIRSEDMTDQFIKGAEQTLNIARIVGCRQAILKERSPSCGVHQVYRQKTVIPGQGVTAALLKRDNISVYSEDELHKLALCANRSNE